jgi:pyruvyltransferase
VSHCRRVFYWRGHSNFGDELALTIIRRLTRYSPVWSPARSAELVVTGSIASMLPAGWHGTVAGICCARPEVFDATKATVLALRGHLTRAHTLLAAGSPEPVLGDPGLLASLLVPRPLRTGGLAIVPHWQDRDLTKKWGDRGTLVRVENDPLAVIRAIALSDRVVSSSLHGIIVADAYGIERMWDPHPATQGAGFKFYDHATVVGPIEPGEWGIANQQQVGAARDALLSALGHV